MKTVAESRTADFLKGERGIGGARSEVIASSIFNNVLCRGELLWSG
jgi:hypothetical protein